MKPDPDVTTVKSDVKIKGSEIKVAINKYFILENKYLKFIFNLYLRYDKI